MKGVKEVIDLLNEVLAGELVAINQYFLHAKMCNNWGYRRLAANVRHESNRRDEARRQLADRILFLDGLPNFQRLDPLSHRADRARAAPVRRRPRVPGGQAAQRRDPALPRSGRQRHRGHPHPHPGLRRGARRLAGDADQARRAPRRAAYLASSSARAEANMCVAARRAGPAGAPVEALTGGP